MQPDQRGHCCSPFKLGNASCSGKHPSTFATERHRKEIGRSLSTNLQNVLHPGLFSEQRHRELFRSECPQHPPHDIIVVRQAHIRLEGGVAEIGLGCHLGKARTSAYGEQERAREGTKGGGREGLVVLLLSLHDGGEPLDAWR